MDSSFILCEDNFTVTQSKTSIFCVRFFYFKSAWIVASIDKCIKCRCLTKCVEVASSWNDSAQWSLAPQEQSHNILERAYVKGFKATFWVQ